ncbi:hypothetical protein DDZ13_05535 [Coraliomargarita sinensis]|uniref:Uncharacterized protein n=2 Tax=Coraliomargarita sinensis TaxID=2174842 RepID=A0A317ZG92_9BACT|nr:hypothetical protein DDZ13_05535 [Coraliomargarita sinensis]
MRWYTSYTLLPHPHVIEATDRGKCISLFVLMSKVSAVLKLKMRKGVWWLDNDYDESESGAILPAHASCYGVGLRTSASHQQMHALSNPLMLPRQQLPKLSKYNASLLIQETLIAQHHDEIAALIESVPNPQHKRLKRTA